LEGYERGWAAAFNQGKPTEQPTTPPWQNFLSILELYLKTKEEKDDGIH
jgi:hypothetical protein